MTFKKAEQILSKHPLPPSFSLQKVYCFHLVYVLGKGCSGYKLPGGCRERQTPGKYRGAPPSVLGPGGTRHAWGEYLLKRYWLSAAWRQASLPEVSPEVSHLLGEFHFLIQAVGVCAARTRPMQPNRSHSGSSPEPWWLPGFQPLTL